MKKKLAIYISILAALIAGYIVITKLSEKEVGKEKQVFDLLEGFEICSADVENDSGKYSLTYDPPDWIMDGAKVRSEYIKRLSGIKSDTKLESKDLKSFGLDEPASTVVLKDKDGNVRTLLIGDRVPDNTGRYVMTDEIYVVSNEYTDWLTEDKSILKDRIIYSADFPEKVEFNGICFETTEDGIWRMTSPYDHGVKATELKEEVLDSLNFEAVDFTDKSPAECGLDPPCQYISVWERDGVKTTVYFGDRSDGLVYAMRDGSDEICRVIIPGFLDKKAIFFLNTLCYVKNIKDINEIDVNGIVFDISGDGYKKDGKYIEKDNFINFYKQLMGMTLIDEATDPVKDKLILSMKVKFKDGRSDIVEVYEYKERYGAVFINGICTFYTLGDMPKEIVARAEAL